MINKSILISKFILLVACVYCTGTVLLAQEKQNLSLEKIWYSGEFSQDYPNSFKGMADGETYCLAEVVDNHTEVWQYQVKDSKKVKMLFSTQSILVDEKPVNMQSFDFSKDESKVVIRFNVNNIYRHSYTSLNKKIIGQYFYI